MGETNKIETFMRHLNRHINRQDTETHGPCADRKNELDLCHSPCSFGGLGILLAFYIVLWSVHAEVKVDE